MPNRPVLPDSAPSGDLEIGGHCSEAVPCWLGCVETPSPRLHLVQVLLWLLLASCSLGSDDCDADTDRFLGEKPSSAQDKRALSTDKRHLGSESWCLLMALVPSFWEEYGVSLPTLVLPNLWQHPWVQATPALTEAHSHGSEVQMPCHPLRTKTMTRAVWTGCGRSLCCGRPLCQLLLTASRTSLPSLHPLLFLPALEAGLTFRIFPADKAHLI